MAQPKHAVADAPPTVAAAATFGGGAAAAAAIYKIGYLTKT
ncbi:MAG: hypothetical protein ACRD47_05890 [Nitrososphaeraceae archaeon]